MDGSPSAGPSGIGSAGPDGSVRRDDDWLRGGRGGMTTSNGWTLSFLGAGGRGVASDSAGAAFFLRRDEDRVLLRDPADWSLRLTPVRPRGSSFPSSCCPDCFGETGMGTWEWGP